MKPETEHIPAFPPLSLDGARLLSDGLQPFVRNGAGEEIHFFLSVTNSLQFRVSAVLRTEGSGIIRFMKGGTCTAKTSNEALQREANLLIRELVTGLDGLTRFDPELKPTCHGYRSVRGRHFDPGSRESLEVDL